MRIFLCVIILCSFFYIKILTESNDQALFVKEWKLLQSIMTLGVQDKKNISDIEKRQLVKFRRRLIEFEFELLDEFKRKGDAFDLVDKPEKRKQLARIVYRYAKNHQEITDFTKNVIKILAKFLISLTNTEMRSPYYEKFQSADISFEEMVIMFQEYIPQDVDIAFVGMEYVVWAHGYLYAYLQKKNLFTKFIGFADTDCIQNRSIDTICYALRELGIFFKFPKKTQKIWDEFIVVLQNGLKDLPQDMKLYLVKNMDQFVSDSLIVNFAKVLDSTIKIKKASLVDGFVSSIDVNQEEDEDDELWDKFVELWLHKMKKNPIDNSIQSENYISCYTIFEKMIFKI